MYQCETSTHIHKGFCHFGEDDVNAPPPSKVSEIANNNSVCAKRCSEEAGGASRFEDTSIALHHLSFPSILVQNLVQLQNRHWE